MLNKSHKFTRSCCQNLLKGHNTTGCMIYLYNYCVYPVTCHWPLQPNNQPDPPGIFPCLPISCCLNTRLHTLGRGSQAHTILRVLSRLCLLTECVRICALYRGGLPAEPKPEWQFCALLMKTTWSGSNDNNGKQGNKKGTNTLLAGIAGTFLNSRMMITAARLVSVVFDCDVNDSEHICMLHCLSVISGQCSSRALI